MKRMAKVEGVKYLIDMLYSKINTLSAQELVSGVNNSRIIARQHFKIRQLTVTTDVSLKSGYGNYLSPVSIYNPWGMYTHNPNITDKGVSITGKKYSFVAVDEAKAYE